VFRKDYIPELDGLRGIAVLLVLWVHLPTDVMGETLHRFQKAVLPGNVGVDLFFVLSGFLITRILLVDRGAGRPLGHFLMRRFLRIFPIYYLLLGLLAIRMQWREILACATYTSNYLFLFKSQTSLLEHSWSLAIEEHFYLLWPPVVLFLVPRISRRVLLWGVFPLSALTLAAVLGWGDWETRSDFLEELLGRGSTSRFGSLGLGALQAYHEAWVRRGGWGPLLFAGGCFSLAFLLSGVGLGVSGLGEFPSDLPLIGGDGARLRAATLQVRIPAMSLGVVVLAVAHSTRALPWSVLWRSPPLRGIGRISYGLYLYHFPIFQGLLGGAGGGRVLLALGSSFAAAGLSFWIIERPIMKLSARFRES